MAPLLLGLVIGQSVSAQDDSIVDMAPYAIIESGSIDSQGLVFTTGKFADQFEHELTMGRRLEITLSSEDFNAYLMVIDPTGMLYQNDDGPGYLGTSVLELVVDNPGVWKVIATSASPRESGKYELQILVDSSNANSMSDADFLADLFGSEYPMEHDFSGELDARDRSIGERNADLFELELSRGQYVEAMLTAVRFEPYLMIAPPTGEQFHDERTDASLQESYVVAEVQESGMWTFVVTSAEPGGAGPYSFLVTVHEAKPPTPPGIYTRVIQNRIAANDPILDKVGLYTFQLEPGDRVFGQVDSDEFSPLVFYGPARGTERNPVSFDGSFSILADSEGDYSVAVAGSDDNYGYYLAELNYDFAYAHELEYDYVNLCDGLEKLAAGVSAKFVDSRASEFQLDLLGKKKWRGITALPGVENCTVRPGLTSGANFSYTCELGANLEAEPMQLMFENYEAEVRECLSDWELSSEPPKISLTRFSGFLKASRDGASVELRLENHVGTGNELVIRVGK